MSIENHKLVCDKTDILCNLIKSEFKELAKLGENCSIGDKHSRGGPDFISRGPDSGGDKHSRGGPDFISRSPDSGGLN